MFFDFHQCLLWSCCYGKILLSKLNSVIGKFARCGLVTTCSVPTHIQEAGHEHLPFTLIPPLTVIMADSLSLPCTLRGNERVSLWHRPKCNLDLGRLHKLQQAAASEVGLEASAALRGCQARRGLRQPRPSPQP